MKSLINNCIVCLYKGTLVLKKGKKSHFKWKNSIIMNQQLYCVFVYKGIQAKTKRNKNKLLINNSIVLKSVKKINFK